ncbi:hypothetical protein KC19_9G053200 [Ceratodon purpureus]|uniref:Uncharacterized protein n=1 Tax=Ceratodon purpureus TaxID=3225 RepID=A0A8T0GQL6_CERPU|nr:hypothetical protein KC19_9G053200 [Ceratodon purpureus]
MECAWSSVPFGPYCASLISRWLFYCRSLGIAPLTSSSPSLAPHHSLPAMALQMLHSTTHLTTFNGLKAAPSVRRVNKVSGVGCVRNSASQSIKAVMNPMDDPIVKEAIKEPIAFLGGVFAGLLRLDLNEEPLKDWVAKTAEAAGIDLDDSQAADMDDSIPKDIQID